MRTYIYTETDSPVRGDNVRVTVWRIKQNRPHQLNCVDRHTSSWYGARGEAMEIIHEVDNIPWVHHENGSNHLKNLLGFADLYDTTNGPGVRLFAL